jgi:hypothetical protein
MDALASRKFSFSSAIIESNISNKPLSLRELNQKRFTHKRVSDAFSAGSLQRCTFHVKTKSNRS